MLKWFVYIIVNHIMSIRVPLPRASQSHVPAKPQRVGPLQLRRLPCFPPRTLLSPMVSSRPPHQASNHNCHACRSTQLHSTQLFSSHHITPFHITEPSTTTHPGTRKRRGTLQYSPPPPPHSPPSSNVTHTDTHTHPPTPDPIKEFRFKFDLERKKPPI